MSKFDSMVRVFRLDYRLATSILLLIPPCYQSAPKGRLKLSIGLQLSDFGPGDLAFHWSYSTLIQMLFQPIFLHLSPATGGRGVGLGGSLWDRSQCIFYSILLVKVLMFIYENNNSRLVPHFLNYSPFYKTTQN